MAVSKGDKRRFGSGLRNAACFLVLLMVLVCGVVPGAAADANDSTGLAVESGSPGGAGPIEIRTGFLIGPGGYVPPPYLVCSHDESVYVNEQVVSIWPWRRGFRRPPGSVDSGGPGRPERFGGPGGSRRGMPMGRDTSRIEQHLRNDGMIICLDDVPSVTASLRQAIQILDVLTGDQPAEAKIQALMDLNVMWMASEQWGIVLEHFKPTDELLIRLQQIKKRYEAEDRKLAHAEKRFLRLHSIITIFGFMLAVWSFGSLFSCRSPLPNGGAQGHASGVSPRQVVRLIVLISMLSVYDLVCTLFADGLGGLWELNPLAGSLLSSRISIVTFKLVTTAGAATVLYITRHHRFAQLAAWWAGVLYTILILRWATFNSVFLSG